MDKIKFPDKYKFTTKRVSSHCYDTIFCKLLLAKSNKVIGRVTLELDCRSYRTHSSLDKIYRGKGLGTLMYAAAIQYALDRGHKVRSSGHTSLNAQRVWKSKGLRKYFKIRFVRHPQYTPEFDVWYASDK